MKIKALIQRIPATPEIQKVAKKHRKAIGVPDHGFDSFDEWGAWQRAIKNDKRSKNFEDFFVKAEKIIPYHGLISKTALKQILLDFYYLRIFDIEGQYETHKYDLFSVGMVIDRKTKALNLTKGEGLKDGVYLRIPSNVDPSEMKNFLTDNKNLVVSVQSSFNKRKGFKEVKIQHLDTLERDEVIAALFEYSLDDLERISEIPRAKGTPRPEYIARVLSEYLGFKKISGDAVVQAKKRWNRKKNKLFE